MLDNLITLLDAVIFNNGYVFYPLLIAVASYGVSFVLKGKLERIALTLGNALMGISVLMIFTILVMSL